MLKSTDAILLASMILTSLGISSHIILNKSEQTASNKAQKSAEIISAQLMSFSLENIQVRAEREERFIASSNLSVSKPKSPQALGPEGVIGKDPWGQPFHYKFVPEASGRFEFLVVWSKGPNGRSKIDYRKLGVHQAANMLGTLELGDDLGLITRTPE